MDEPSPSLSSHALPGDDEPPSSAVVVELTDPSALLGRDDAAWLIDRTRDACVEIPCTGEIRVRVIRDDEMAELHERHTGVPGTTDVLTFDLREAATGPLDVDITVCHDEARRRADEYGHDPRRELLLYIVHGVLHCLGHDDHDEDAYTLMHNMEDELLERIGVGRTFDPNSTADAHGGAS